MSLLGEIILRNISHTVQTIGALELIADTRVDYVVISPANTMFE